MHSALLPVVSYAADSNSPEEVYLLEDGLALWFAVLHMASGPSPQLFSLYTLLPPVLDNGYEHLEISMKILETYLLLGGNEFMAEHATSVAQLFGKVIGNVKDEGTMLVLRPMQTLLQLFPKEGPALLEPVLATIMGSLLSRLETDIINVAYISLFARIATSHPTFIPGFFERLSSNPQNISRQNLFAPFVEMWLDKIDNMGQARMRKMSTMGLCSLMPATEQILPFVQQIVVAGIGIIPDVDETRDAELSDFSSYFEDISESRSAAERQLQHIFKADIVTTIPLRPFLLQKIEESSKAHGAAFMSLVQSIDPIVLKFLDPPPPINKME